MTARISEAPASTSAAEAGRGCTRALYRRTRPAARLTVKCRLVPGALHLLERGCVQPARSPRQLAPGVGRGEQRVVGAQADAHAGREPGRKGMIVLRSDHPGVDVAGETGFDGHAALDDQLDHLRL